MLRITKEQFENNFEDYCFLGQKEEIEVSSNGKVLFVIVPQKIRDLATFS